VGKAEGVSPGADNTGRERTVTADELKRGRGGPQPQHTQQSERVSREEHSNTATRAAQAAHEAAQTDKHSHERGLASEARSLFFFVLL
jgi:hypothetical protein